MSRSPAKAALALMLSACAAGCSPPTVVFENTTTVPEVDDSVASCVERGVAYFKEIGSYPTLKSAPNAGKSADDVALERCVRATTAF